MRDVALADYPEAMSSKPTGTPEDAPEGSRQVEDVHLYEVGQRLIDLGEQLRTIGDHTAGIKLRREIERANQIAEEVVFEDLDREIRDAVRRTLTGLGQFRKEYSGWERIVVEYALTKHGFTQRDVARLLGVGLSTVNRWAQHPLTYED